MIRVLSRACGAHALIEASGRCPQALRRECMKHAKRSVTLANISRIEREIQAVDAESQRATELIDVRHCARSPVTTHCLQQRRNAL